MMINNNINFKGINNLKVYKKGPYSIYGQYPDSNGEIRQGEKINQELKIHVDLTNDEKGKHLSEYVQKFSYAYINKTNPEQLDLHLTTSKIKDSGEVIQSLYVNGTPFIVNNDTKLPALSYLAKITRESANDEKASKNQQEILNIINQSIQTMAEEYLEVK